MTVGLPLPKRSMREVGGLVGVFDRVPEADDDAVVWKVDADALTDGAGLGEGEGRQG